MKINNLEKLLPLGYLILVILGILKESVFYYFLGINILKYSTLIDILISPISDLTAHPIVLIFFSAYMLLFYAIFSYASKYPQKKWVYSLIREDNTKIQLTNDEIQRRLGSSFLMAITIGMFTFFLGIGIGSGTKVATKLENHALEYRQILTFPTNEKSTIYLINSNSSYHFYVEEGTKNVKITPISNIKSIEFQPKKQKKGSL